MKKTMLIFLTSLCMFNTITPFFWSSAVDSMYEDLAKPIILSQKSSADKRYEIKELKAIMIRKMKDLKHRIEEDTIEYHSRVHCVYMIAKPIELMGFATLGVSILAFFKYLQSSYTNEKALEGCKDNLFFSISAFLTNTLMNYLPYWELKLSKSKLQDLQLFIERLETVLDQLKKETIAA